MPWAGLLADMEPAHLECMFEELLDNAAKFADKSSARVTLSVAQTEPAWLRCSVSDDGPGIPHEYYDRVLDGFVQLEDRATGRVPGLGIGLCMTRRLVEAYGGRIVIESHLGGGTVISFTLPAGQS